MGRRRRPLREAGALGRHHARILSELPAAELDADVEGNFDGPDNITVSPHGGLILAEDGSGVSHLVGVTDQGKSYPLARNEYNNSEFCGPAFSKDGKWLFANIQSPGFTLAITGPWTGTRRRRHAPCASTSPPPRSGSSPIPV